MTEQQITKAVNGIIFDLSDRRGLKGQWNLIDDDTQEEIKEAWKQIIRDAAGKA
jgi:hypothetical protein